MSALARRGPDARGEYVQGDWWFGHRRLAIIGLGHPGDQPMVTDPGHVLVYNGEVYNYRALASDLGVAALSDTEVLYEIGRRGLWSTYIGRLRGMFAFIHVDLHRRRITAARDPFGIKPLYVRRHKDGGLSFASTVAALAALDRRDLTLDRSALTGFLAMGLFPAGTSPYREVEKLTPGSMSTWTDQGDRNWKVSESAISPSGWPELSVPEALADSVRAHLVSDVEVGVLLSGGVDSTLLAARASRMNPDIRTFCLTNPENADIDEAALARHNAALLGTRHVEVPVTPSSLAPLAQALVASTGEPFGDAAYLPLSALCEVVGRDVKVALAGEGADELFGGYRRYDIERLLDAEVLGPAARWVGRLARGDRRYPLPVSQAQRIVHASALVRAADRHAALMFFAWSTVTSAFEFGHVQHEAFLSRWERLTADPWAVGRSANHAYDTREWLPNVFLEKSDRAAMLHSLELRTPYLDPVMAAAAGRVPLRDSRKRPLRDELHRLVPDVRLPPRKQGLSVDTGALVTGHYRDLVRSTVLEPGSVLERIGLQDGEGLWHALVASPPLAFRVAMLGLWHERWATGPAH